MTFLVVKFRSRDPNDISNKYLAEIYENGPQFDIDLIGSDQKIVSAHKYVVSMFSVYLKDYLSEFKPKGKACVPLSEISSFVLKKVIDLFYKGQIMIGAEVKPHMIKALSFLKVPDVRIRSPEQEQQSTQSNKDMPAPSLPKQSQLVQQNINRYVSMNNDQRQSSQPAMRGQIQSVLSERFDSSSSPSMVKTSEIRGNSLSIMKINAPSAITPTMNSQLDKQNIQQQECTNST